MVRFPIICRLLALYNTILFLIIAYFAAGELLKALFSLPGKDLGIKPALFICGLLAVIIFSNLFTLSDGDSNPGQWISFFVVASIGLVAAFAPEARPPAVSIAHIALAISPSITTILILVFGKPEYRRPIYRSNNGPYTQPNSDAYE